MRVRTGREIRPESRLLDDLLKEIVKERLKHRIYVIKWVLVDTKGYSLSDYDRFIKWINDFPKGRRIHPGLLIDILTDLGIPYQEVFEEALRRRARILKEREQITHL
ncbi:hypothetical protein Theam_1730 (plasmid) [Thermovibrio ammonificans HB-1]|uniref:Uncharacterized protein n=1 Tax=Thermovibrio ammonificans (strain DSM 15698 / JCM 12110 / HB-1) TaxID=648996 RepID=E8T6W5_THEA1|nr:hypothetical protein [Thermovibrio ammonificans]ADU97686.1 hypothetical protein Theam_1730 [Thermovibrio ammonificans HB-1]